MKLKTQILENTWLKSSYAKAAAYGISDLTLNHGWGNGYVIIPEGHPCFKMSYDEIHENYDIDVHGGLTYSEMAEDGNDVFKHHSGCWVVGFDTAHYRDTLDRWPKEAVQAETERLREQLESIV